MGPRGAAGRRRRRAPGAGAPPVGAPADEPQPAADAGAPLEEEIAAGKEVDADAPFEGPGVREPNDPMPPEPAPMAPVPDPAPAAGAGPAPAREPGLVGRIRFFRDFEKRISWKRVFAHKAAANRQPGARTDFTETVYWNAGLVTDADGRATFEFDAGDAITTIRIGADGFARNGALGSADGTVEVRRPFYVEPKFPLEVLRGRPHRAAAGARERNGRAAADHHSRRGRQGHAAARSGPHARPTGFTRRAGPGLAQARAIPPGGGLPWVGEAAPARQRRAVRRRRDPHDRRAAGRLPDRARLRRRPGRRGRARGRDSRRDPARQRHDGDRGVPDAARFHGRRPGRDAARAARLLRADQLHELPERDGPPVHAEPRGRGPGARRQGHGDARSRLQAPRLLRVQEARLRVVRRRSRPRGPHRLRRTGVPRHGEGHGGGRRDARAHARLAAREARRRRWLQAQRTCSRPVRRRAAGDDERLRALGAGRGGGDGAHQGDRRAEGFRAGDEGCLRRRARGQCPLEERRPRRGAPPAGSALHAAGEGRRTDGRPGVDHAVGGQQPEDRGDGPGRAGVAALGRARQERRGGHALDVGAVPWRALRFDPGHDPGPEGGHRLRRVPRARDAAGHRGPPPQRPAAARG